MLSLVEQVVIPLIKKRGWKQVCEIGAKLGESTERLRRIPGVSVTVIDPCLDCDLGARYSAYQNVTVIKGLSLEVLPKLEGAFDGILIDGDHNWYTVYHELKAIHERDLLEVGGMVFFDDVGWPYGRRDMYYQPETIPENYRHASAKMGIERGRSALCENVEFNAAFWNATHEGGARNGVLTAIEEFVREHKTEYRFFAIQGDNGLGVMQRREGFGTAAMFLGLRARGMSYNCLSWLRRSTQMHFPASYTFLRSLLK